MGWGHVGMSEGDCTHLGISFSFSFFSSSHSLTSPPLPPPLPLPFSFFLSLLPIPHDASTLCYKSEVAVARVLVKMETTCRKFNMVLFIQRLPECSTIFLSVRAQK